MFDFGIGELLIIGLVALIVVGPKDLPVLFRQVGNFVGKAKAMGREFSSAMNNAAANSGLDDVKSTLDTASKTFKTATNPIKGTADALAEHAKAAARFDPESETGKLAAKRAEETRQRQEEAAQKKAQKDAEKQAEPQNEASVEDATAASAKAAPEATAATAAPVETTSAGIQQAEALSAEKPSKDASS